MSSSARLGIFILAMLVLFFAGIFWIGNRQFLFNSTYQLSADFPNVAGLADGADVRVAGIHEGTVSSIQLPARPTEKIRVIMRLARASQRVVKKDSVASIQSEGLVGDEFVEISFGSEQAPGVKDRDTIRGEPPMQISDLMNKANGILDTAGGALAAINGTAGNLNSITDKINRGQGSVGAFINDKKLYQNVNESTMALKNDMEALQHNFFLRGFFKERGYSSAAELKRNEISQLPGRAPQEKFDFEAKKLFDKPDAAKLKGAKELNSAGKYLEDHRFGVAVVAAYADMKGDSQQERLLTEARAMVVRDYLVKNFSTQDTKIKTIGMGKSKKLPKAAQCKCWFIPRVPRWPGVPKRAGLRNRPLRRTRTVSHSD